MNPVSSRQYGTILLRLTLSRARKKSAPVVSATTTTLPSRLHLTLVMGFLWTLNALIRANFLSSRPTNLTIPSEKPTASSLPLFFFEKGSHSMQVASPLVANF